MHFKDRFLKTLGKLIFNPGFLSSEYKKGNRNEYLNPILLFFVTTALFFLVFFTGFRNKNISFGKTNGKSFVKRGTVHLLREGYKNAKTKEDSATIAKTIKAFEDSARFNKDDDEMNELSFELFGSVDSKYKTVTSYDSTQQLLPADQKDGWYEKAGIRRGLILNERYRTNERQFWSDLSNSFIHYTPYLVFVLLPLFALFLKLVQVRRKQFLFRDHSMFLMHIYAFMFMLMLLYLGVLGLKEYADDDRLVLTAMIILGVGCIYAIRAMKKFYGQSWGKTILKFILLNILCLAVLLAAFIVVFSISVSWL